jgi:hypothetical protein
MRPELSLCTDDLETTSNVDCTSRSTIGAWCTVADALVTGPGEVCTATIAAPQIPAVFASLTAAYCCHQTKRKHCTQVLALIVS